MLDGARLDAIVQAVADELPGDWLLVGGAAVALWLDPRRVTEDLDLIGFQGTPAERWALMELGERQGLPVEAVNSAADFFVFRIADWRDHIVLLRTGAAGRVYRPDATLLIELKLGRLTEQDLADCLAAIAASFEPEPPLDRERLLRVSATLSPTEDAALAARRARLRDALAGFGAGPERGGV
ncbi:MAG: hypothetical protein JW751_24360 [Polyangiaceae bacterium]|nr:hypothetical protein [Polyangiaceae bacterium]